MKFLERVRMKFRANRYRNRSEKTEIDLVRNLLQPGQCAFDIGAHRGVYLYYMRLCVGDSGRVVAFEPQDALTRHLNRIKSAFGWENVAIEHCAMSDNGEGGVLFVPQNKRSSNTTTQLATIAPGEGRSDFKPIAKIRTETIDAYCERHGLRPDFIKIDVEGNEFPVLRGAEKTLRDHQVSLLVEIEARHAGADKMQETFAWMSSLGYEGSLLHDDGLIPLERFSVAEHQDTGNMEAYYNNFIFRKKGTKN